MASKSGSKKKPGITRSGDAVDKDLILELKNRIAVLENELRLKHGQTILDTTERKQAIEKLSERERFLRNVFECIQEGISVLDKDLNIIQVNPAMEKRFGEHIAGKKCYQAYHGRLKPCELCPSIRAIKTGSAQTEVVCDLNGWSEIYAFPLVNDRGEVTGVIEHVRDINERKQVEEALRESEGKFRSLAESVNAGIVLIRGDKFIYVNPVTTRDLGYTEDELLAINFWDVIHPDSRELVRSRAFKRLQGLPEPYTYEIKILTKGGETLWEQLSSTVIDYKGEPTILATIFNITERKQAEEALQESEEKYRHIVETTNQGICTLDASMMITFINNRLAEMMGYSPEEMIGRSVRDFVDETGWAIAIERMGEQWRGISGSFEIKAIRKDGTPIWMIISAVPRYDKDSKFAGSFAMLTDITERLHFEEELKTAKQQAELYLDLMGHDINNMHQVALGYLELARGMPPGEEQVRLLEKPVEVLQRSTQLIHNVRKLQKLQEGAFQTKEIDVCEVLRDVQREFGAVPKKAITLNTNRCERCLVHANELLHDVIANLVSNAIKHTGDRADIVIDMDVLNDNDNKYCRVIVEDNGPGVPDGFKGKIFNRMLRGTTKAKGMGLGLYLVKSLIDSYGGSIWVEDRIHGDHTKGARFVVMLPAVEK